MVNRICLGFAVAIGVLWAQSETVSSIRISTQPSGARFYVDGQIYTAPQVFLWPQGSKHIVQFPSDRSEEQWTGYQVSKDGLLRYQFNGWFDGDNLLLPSSAQDQTVTASPKITSLTARLAVEYRVYLRFMSLPAGRLTPDCAAPGDAPRDYLRPGVIFAAGRCFDANADLWLAGDAAINAFPYPGFVFTGWNINGTPADPYLKSLNIDRPITLYARFEPAKRVEFVTVPSGMKLIIDRTTTPTTFNEKVDYLGTQWPECKANLSLAGGAPITIEALCMGQFDFLPGSRHLFAALTPQIDNTGRWWVFDKFSNGLEQNGVYTADANTSVREVITATFVPGVQTAFLTNPPGLKLNVDGRENWPSYTFIWGAGTNHVVTAPATQTDANGRRWTFEGWSNGGAARQELTADGNGPGMRLIANYTGLGQVKLVTNPPGIPLMVDGTECPSPCVVDRQSGSEIAVSAPESVHVSDDTRLDLLGWTDGGESTHSFKMPAEQKTIVANYGYAYRFLVVSDPAGGADISGDPASPDSFYPADSVVTITAKARSGFKFRRWAGDLGGVYPSAQAVVSGPRAAIASLDRVPYIAPAGIKNAAGDTPEKAVAPGSIISVYGESLAPQLETGPTNPLAQTLADVVVTVNDRILPLLFVSPQQINAQLVSDLPDGEYTLRVRWTGKPDVTGTFTVSRNSPGLFTRGDSEIRYVMGSHEDGTPITPDSRARKGELVTVFGTGFGPFKQRSIDGFAFPAGSNAEMADPIEVLLGEVSIRPEWSGAAPGFVGMTATRFRIPPDMDPARSNLRIRINSKTSNGVVLPIE